MTTQFDSQAVVFVSDDDASLREGMLRLFRSVGLRAQAFGSTAEFLQIKRADFPAAWCSTSGSRASAASNFRTN